MKLATLCYVQSAQSTLMLYRGKKPGDIHAGKWNGLGGKLEAGEDPDSGVVREVKEESGLVIRQPRLAGVLTFPEFKDGQDWYVFVYTARDFAGELIECSEGELAWIKNEDLLGLPLWEGDKSFLPWVLEGRFFSAKFHYKDMQLVAKQAVVYEGVPGEIVEWCE